jgi:hypothetical protein
MKDLRLFTSGTEIGSLRVDSISGEGNLTVMETYKLNDRLESFDPEDGNFQLKVVLAQNFQKLPKTFTDIIEFATSNSLTLLKQDQDSSEILVGGISITSTSPLTAGTNGQAYSVTLTKSGDSGNVSFSVVSGSLPTGLSLNASTGAITGTCGATGTFNFTIRMYDNVYLSEVTKAFVIVVS